MSSTHHQTDEEVFTTALTLKSFEEQEQYVAISCAKDVQQRDRVLSLLVSHRKLEKIDTTFVLDRSDEVCSTLMGVESVSVGEQVGPYRIMQLLGEGGWVWSTKQNSLPPFVGESP